MHCLFQLLQSLESFGDDVSVIDSALLNVTRRVDDLEVCYVIPIKLTIKRNMCHDSVVTTAMVTACFVECMSQVNVILRVISYVINCHSIWILESRVQSVFSRLKKSWFFLQLFNGSVQIDNATVVTSEQLDSEIQQLTLQLEKLTRCGLESWENIHELTSQVRKANADLEVSNCNLK